MGIDLGQKHFKAQLTFPFLSDLYFLNQMANLCNHVVEGSGKTADLIFGIGSGDFGIQVPSHNLLHLFFQLKKWTQLRIDSEKCGQKTYH